MKKLLLLIFLLIVLTPVFLLGFLGLVPGLSTLLGADKPRDLGTKYTRADLISEREKSQVKYEAMAANLPPAQSREFVGARQVTAEFTSSEITATLNDQLWHYWPYKNVQVKFNGDGSGEISGILLKDKLPGYAAAIGVPVEVVNFAMKFLPANPVFYVKMKASLADNRVDVFEPQEFQIGRIPMPLNLFLSFEKSTAGKVYAQDIGEMVKELGKVDNKKALIISYINSRLSTEFGSFYAKKAYFSENKLYFDGTLTEKIRYAP